MPICLSGVSAGNDPCRKARATCICKEVYLFHAVRWCQGMYVQHHRSIHKRYSHVGILGQDKEASKTLFYAKNYKQCTDCFSSYSFLNHTRWISEKFFDLIARFSLSFKHNCSVTFFLCLFEAPACWNDVLESSCNPLHFTSSIILYSLHAVGIQNLSVIPHQN